MLYQICKKIVGIFSWQTIVICRDKIPTISIYKTCNFSIYNVKRSFAICFRCLLINAKNQPLLKEIQFPVMLIPLLELFRIFFFHRVQIRMTANIFLTALQDADSDIRTVICDTLQAGGHICQHKPHLNRTSSLFQTDNMTTFQLDRKSVV